MPTTFPDHSFDPTTKLETWLFQKMGTSADGRPIYKRLPYNLVEYDGDRIQYIEPVSGVLDGSGDPINPLTDGVGKVVGINYYDARPFEVVGFNDVDASNNLGQLP
jgi:hypothetical protein